MLTLTYDLYEHKKLFISLIVNQLVKRSKLNVKFIYKQQITNKNKKIFNIKNWASNFKKTVPYKWNNIFSFWEIKNHS